jgi:hypothetical protein
MYERPRVLREERKYALGDFILVHTEHLSIALTA